MNVFEWLSVLGAVVLFWGRVEHRITKLETWIKLNCPNCPKFRVPIKRNEREYVKFR